MEKDNKTIFNSCATGLRRTAFIAAGLGACVGLSLGCDKALDSGQKIINQLRAPSR